MDVIMSSATFPLDNFWGWKHAPCLLVSCPTTQQAVKLLHHTMRTTEGVDVFGIICDLIDQGIADERVSGIFHQRYEIYNMSMTSCLLLG